jgi:hypothetical protein
MTAILLDGESYTKARHHTEQHAFMFCYVINTDPHVIDGVVNDVGRGQGMAATN